MKNEGLDMSRYPSTLEIRRWAQARKPGHVGDLGHLPKVVIVAWNRTHPDRPYVGGQSFHATVNGYLDGCRCIGCCESGRAGNREYARRSREGDTRRSRESAES